MVSDHDQFADGHQPISTNGNVANCAQDTVSSMYNYDIAYGSSSVFTQLYSEVLFCPSLRTVSIYDRLYEHFIGGLRSQMNLSTWLYELSYESDSEFRNFLTKGITNGFIIVNPYCEIGGYYCYNYSSALQGDAFHVVDSIIQDELSQEKYVISDDIPHCVHSMGAVPKKDGGYRIITDCKWPLGSSINNFMDDTVATFSYKSVDDVIELLFPGAYMATVDISSAYRSISVHPDQWDYQGLYWNLNGSPVHLKDTRICFGLRNAPFLFTRVSNFIVRCMARRGYHLVVNYVDDFIVLGDSFESCQQAQLELISLLGSLGFQVSWKKCSSPSTITRYLGIDIDSVSMQLSLPEDKLVKLRAELFFFKNKICATKRQLQRLCGILSHCSKVIKGARTFSRRIVDLLKGLGDGNPRICLHAEFQKDMQWWRDFATIFNGVACCISYNYGQGPVLFTDASQTGYGIHIAGDWQAGFFNSEVTPEFVYDTVYDHQHWFNIDTSSNNINELELIPVYLAMLRMSSKVHDCHVVCYTDNTQVLSNINKGISTNKYAMSILRQVFLICVTRNIHLTARHIAGEDNVIADYLSRLHTAHSIELSKFQLCCSELIETR